MADDIERPAEPGSGTVEIELDGKTHTLEPTLGACLKLAAFPGGIAGLLNRCANYDFNTIVEVVAIGLGVNPNQKEKLVAPAVFKRGMVLVAPEAMRFLRAILHGGKLPADEEDEDEEGGDQDPLAGSASQSENSIPA